MMIQESCLLCLPCSRETVCKALKTVGSETDVPHQLSRSTLKDKAVVIDGDRQSGGCPPLCAAGFLPHWHWPKLGRNEGPNADWSGRAWGLSTPSANRAPFAYIKSMVVAQFSRSYHERGHDRCKGLHPEEKITGKASLTDVRVLGGFDNHEATCSHKVS